MTWHNAGVLVVVLNVMACSSPVLHLLNETGKDVMVTVGKKEFPVKTEWNHVTVDIKPSAGSHLVASSGGTVVDDQVVTAALAGRDIIFNVAGAGDFFLVDYSKAYLPEGSKETIPAKPFEIVTSLKGKSVVAAPKGVLVEYTGALPRRVGKGVKVMRVELVPPSLAVRGVDDHLLTSLITDMQMRGSLYFQ